MQINVEDFGEAIKKAKSKIQLKNGLFYQPMSDEYDLKLGIVAEKPELLQQQLAFLFLQMLANWKRGK